jgi:hypothetical protein
MNDRRRNAFDDAVDVKGILTKLNVKTLQEK